MNINNKTQRQLRIQNVLFYLLMIGLVILLAQLSLKTDTQMDWTSNQRHSLSKTTTAFLKQLNKPIIIQAFVSEGSELKYALTTLLNRYKKYQPALSIDYIDPNFSPDIVRKLKIQQQGEMVVSLGDQKKHVLDLSEQSLTNALISVSREQDKWLVFIEGHGERQPEHQANFNLSTLTTTLKQKGFKTKTLNLIQHQQIPRNTAAVIIASPEKPWLSGEITILKEYLAIGGNLLWLIEPSDKPTLSPLAEHLGLDIVLGTVIDPNTELLGIPDRQFALVTNYANHPIGQATSSVTLFPKATALELKPHHKQPHWQYQALLTTPENVWSDTTPSLRAKYQEGIDTAGPLNLGYLITPIEPQQDKQQRIVVIGDGDFLSNSFIGNAANLELGLAIINWLAEDDSLITIPTRMTVDKQLTLDKMASLFIGLGFLVVVPATLLLIGLSLWWYRRRQ
jgi:ABC-type uncharacterized transport system involved in gliding motility auxiliary subunit